MAEPREKYKDLWKWASTWSLSLLAWSLPLSLFGMQLFMIVCFFLGLLSLLPKNRPVVWPLGRQWLFLMSASLLSLLAIKTEVPDAQQVFGMWVWLTFWAVFLCLPSKRALQIAYWGLMVFSFFASVFAIVQSYTGVFPFGPVVHPHVKQLLLPAFGSNGRFMAVGFFSSRVTFANFLILPASWAFVHVLVARAKARILGVVGILFFLWAMMLTWSRAAPLGLGAVLLLFVILLFRSHWKKLLLGLTGLSLLFSGLVFLSPGNLDRMTNSFNNSKDWGRIVIWNTALDLVSENPIFGIGYGNYSREAKPLIQSRVKQMRVKRFSGKLTWAHNDFLNFLVQGGLVGLFAFLWVFISFGFFCVRLMSRAVSTDEKWMLIYVQGALLGMGAYLVASLFHDNFFHPELGFLVWFVLGSIAWLAREEIEYLPSVPICLGALGKGAFVLVFLLVFANLSYRSISVAHFTIFGLAIVLAVSSAFNAGRNRVLRCLRSEIGLSILGVSLLPCLFVFGNQLLLSFRSSMSIRHGSYGFLIALFTWTLVSLAVLFYPLPKREK